jgi:colicin import membrane protein
LGLHAAQIQKVYQTSQGFYDLALAAPSMKAALEAWGANMNLFRQGFARDADDSDVIARLRWQSPASP